jgi:threonine dehydratase
LPELDAVLVPVGGGGLIAGMAAYLKHYRPGLEIIGVQPEKSPVMQRSVQAGRILDLASEPTLSDGTAGGIEPDALTFPYCQQLVDRFILVSEEEIRDALLFLLEQHQYLVEGAAGLSVAALRREKTAFAGKKVALVLCGRKLGMAALREVLAINA